VLSQKHKIVFRRSEKEEEEAEELKLSRISCGANPVFHTSGSLNE